MAKRPMNNVLSARVDKELAELVHKYTEKMNINAADLIRSAIIEYTTNHPVK